MDYLEVINQPIDINLGTPFIVSIDVLPEQALPFFDLTFQIMGNGLFFSNHNEPVDFLSRFTKRFSYDPNDFIQQCKVQLTVCGDLFHFPVRTVLRVNSQNSSIVNCLINIYDAQV